MNTTIEKIMSQNKFGFNLTESSSHFKMYSQELPRIDGRTERALSDMILSRSDKVGRAER